MKKYLKILLIVFLAVFLIESVQAPVFAAVNSEYFDVSKLDSKSSENLDSVLKSSTVLNYVGKFIYAVARLVEKLVTSFSSWLFGVNVYPWEDLVVYNTIPYLDINFFNPAEGSIFNFSGSTRVGDMIRSIYFSLLTLSLSIIGIGVSITAIRLAISSIAAEKAKYKEAITKCLYTVVLLFSVHILVSFVFYLNETIVSASSKMLSNLITEQERQLIEDNLKAQDKTRPDKFMDYNLYPNKHNFDISLFLSESITGWSQLFGGDFGDVAERYYNDYNTLISSEDGDVARAAGAYLLSQADYRDYRLGGKFISIENSTGSIISGTSVKDCQNAAIRLYIDMYNISKKKTFESFKAEYSGETSTEWYDCVEEAYNTYVLASDTQGQIPNIISTLSDIFKNRAFDKVESNDCDFIAVMLYGILLVQSLALVLNYIKRVFYVTLLAMLGPIVVIYDFFMTSI